MADSSGGYAHSGAAASEWPVVVTYLVVPCCEHEVEPANWNRRSLAVLSEGMCPVCRTTLDEAFCPCCFWFWTQEVVATLADHLVEHAGHGCRISQNSPGATDFVVR